jgi:excisionase family DNA binding protein
MKKESAAIASEIATIARAARPEDRTVDRTGGFRDSGPPDALWDVAQTAGYLRISTSFLYKMTARKARVRIPHIRIGGKLRFRRADVDRWLTLLTVSNLDVLSRLRQKAGADGHTVQTDAP